MSISISQISNTQSFGTWLQRTNDVITILASNTVTTDLTVGGSLTTGNGFVNGMFGANTLYVTNIIAGNVSANASTIYLGSNLVVNGVSAAFGNSSANVILGYLNTTSSIQENFGNQNNYVAVYIQNINTFSSASADLSIYTDFGPSTNTFVDFGMNSSGYSNAAWTINGPNDGYIYSGNNNFSIGTVGTGYINFFANGSQSNNEIMRLTAGANVGIGNTNPNAKLQVTGTANISGDVALGGNFSVVNTISISTIGAANGFVSNNTVISVGNNSINTNITTGNITTNSISTYNLTVYNQIIGSFATTGNIVPSPNNSLSIGTAANVFANAYTTTLNSNVINAANTVIISNNATIYSGNYIFTNNVVQIVDSFSATTFRSAEYSVQIVDNTSPSSAGYQITKLLVVQDGTNAFVTEYGTISSNTTTGSLSTFSANISGTTVRLFGIVANSTIANSSSSNVITKFVRTTITV
jgi:hypothetical protein